MPDFADNYTARYVLKYLCGGQTHNQTWRLGEATTAGAAFAAISAITDVWVAAAVLMSSDLSFMGATFYPVREDVGLPAALPDGINDVVNSGVLDTSAGPKYLSVPWKTQAGGKQTTFFYGTIIDPDEVVGKNFRYEYGELESLDGLITTVNTTIILMTGNDGRNGLAAQRYVNYGVNPALVRRKRRG